MGEWLLEFQKYLSYENPALVEADPSKESVVDQVRRTRRAGRSLRRTRLRRRGGRSSETEQRFAFAG